MADLVTGASGALGGLTGSPSIQLEWWFVILVNPAEEDSSPTTGPLFYLQASTWTGDGDHPVQFQVSTSPTFDTTVHDTTVVQEAGVIVARQVTGLTDGVTYYWRARAGDGVNWGIWSETRILLVEVDTGKAFLSFQVNVGVTVITEPDAVLSSPTNVGLADLRKKNWPVYEMVNVGVPDVTVPTWPVYSVQNITDGTPSPRIWFLDPSYGREGDGISIYGFGFGDLQSTFDGVVEIDYGGVTGWQSVPIISWQTFPADPTAYTEDRVLDELNAIVDPQHTVIQISIPPGAIPPGYPVRVRTEGP
jgi:hypothetical protein